MIPIIHLKFQSTLVLEIGTRLSKTNGLIGMLQEMAHKLVIMIVSFLVFGPPTQIVHSQEEQLNYSVTLKMYYIFNKLKKK